MISLILVLICEEGGKHSWVCGLSKGVLLPSGPRKVAEAVNRAQEALRKCLQEEEEERVEGDFSSTRD